MGLRDMFSRRGRPLVTNPGPRASLPGPTLYSNDVYRLIREQIGPWAKAQGFTRAKGLLSWQRPCGEYHLVFWFQVDQHGWDEYAGSSFTVEFQLGREQYAGGTGKRARLPQFLDADALQELRVIQNEVIESLPRPPQEYLALFEPRIQRFMLSQFEPVAAAYSDYRADFLRYYTEDHVQHWASFVLAQLPCCVEEAENWEGDLREPGSD